MVEEFELLEETEVQFEDSDCAESVWHGVGYCESLFCRKKPAAELTLVIRKEGILYFLCADLPEFQELCRLHGWYVVSHHPFSDTLEIGMCIMEAGRHAGWYSLGHSSERNAVYRELLEYTFERSERQDFYPYETSFKGQCVIDGKYSINSLVYWVTYVHNVVYSFYRSMIYCYINSTQRCAGSIVIDIIPTNGADKRKFFPFAPYFPVTNVIKRYFYPYFPAIIGIKGYSFPYFPYLSGIMKIKTALYSLFSRLDWHKTVVFPCLGEIYEGIRSLSWEIPVT